MVKVALGLAKAQHLWVKQRLLQVYCLDVRICEANISFAHCSIVTKLDGVIVSLQELASVVLRSMLAAKCKVNILCLAEFEKNLVTLNIRA